MHLLNILNQLGAKKTEIELIKDHFKDKVVEHRAVVNLFNKIRGVEKENTIIKKN